LQNKIRTFGVLGVRVSVSDGMPRLDPMITGLSK